MAELVGAVTATARRWHVDTLPSARFLQVEDEIVEVQAVYIADSIITVRRGIEGTTAASHADGTELESPVFGAGAGGGGSIVHESTTDPGAVGAGHFWFQREAGGGGYNQTWIRDAADAEWVPVGPVIAQNGPTASTEMASADNEVTMTLAVGGAVTRLPSGNKTYLAGNTLFNAAVANLPTRAVQLQEGTADPSAGAGISAKLTSLYFRTNGTAGELWIKTGAADTAWTKLTP